MEKSRSLEKSEKEIRIRKSINIKAFTAEQLLDVFQILFSEIMKEKGLFVSLPL